MLRVTIGLGLKRARLENVYNALRGRDAVTGTASEDKRNEQFGLLKLHRSDWNRQRHTRLSSRDLHNWSSLLRHRSGKLERK